MKKTRLNSAVIVVICIYLILPLVLTFFYSIFTEWQHVLPGGVTFRYYAALLTDSSFLLPFLRTFIISVAPVALCLVFILLAMYVVVVHLPWLDRVMQLVCTIPYAIQGIILAISVLSLYSGLPGLLSNRVVMLVFTYCIVVLPYLYQGIKNSLNTVNAPRLLEAAQLLGAGSFTAFFRIIVPNIVSGISVSVMLSISLLFGDFVIINIVAGSYYQTAQVFLYRQLFESGQKSSAVVVILFAVTLLLTNGALFLYNRRAKKRNAREEV
ncbi:putative spermidine/putrescine transport system permease protein [Sporobacter termitidis DSM 10068]|uniref:Putative spermidine/putrescine transport system permease protein n=1 Tax=Sporobacter termitidis DSM 10068 TaxID=1123282 RepID=A0A1M5XQV2_9FIRM|nr:ABC transporter permease subunit [Sporobacter termitidis]SHI02136.1 putative spermidine/putrescine transport system permease protein [Sporobacter termitidis DSM 10068]